MTSSGGFTLRKVFYTVPSRLIGHRLRVRLYDDRLDLFIGGTALMTLTRGRAGATGKHGHVVDYRHVIHALRRKPMALLSLVYRDQLFPRDAYRRTFEFLREEMAERAACKMMVDLLGLAHDRGCEASSPLSSPTTSQPAACPTWRRCANASRPIRRALPEVVVHLAPLSSYDVLVASVRRKRHDPEHRRRSPHPDPQRTAAARDQAGLGSLRRAGRQGGLAGRPLP